MLNLLSPHSQHLGSSPRTLQQQLPQRHFRAGSCDATQHVFEVYGYAGGVEGVFVVVLGYDVGLD